MPCPAEGALRFHPRVCRLQRRYCGEDSNKDADPTADNLLEVRRDLITATAALAGMASIVFGALTNLPVALA